MTVLSFGEWLKRQRKAMGLTQKLLANRVGCSEITLRKLEAEDRRPSVQIIERIAQIFQIPPTEQKNFLRFARGDWDAFNSSSQLEPWQAPKVSTRSNLPASINSFIGRDREIAEICEYLRSKDTRLVTLIGPPGIGKTRLSIETARHQLADFPDGVFFISLAPLEDPALIPTAIMQGLELIETTNKSPLKQLVDGIGSKRMLLVLDNCEHVIDAIALLASGLLSGCSNLNILATSRESLSIPGEWLYAPSPLALPSEDSSVTIRNVDQYPALSLFADRARAVNSGFALTPDNVQTVAAICTQLDGLPLAIELIATRIRFMPPQSLLQLLTDAFVLSADGMRAVSARQKTLNNAIAWSYNLLSVDEQKLMAYLSVFSGGFSVQAAEAMFSPLLPQKSISEFVSALSDKSLLHRTLSESGELRFSMLVTIQQFSLERLRNMGAEENIRRQHLKYFVEFFEQAGRELIGPRQVEWQKRVIMERDNMRSALTWASQNDIEAGMFLIGRLGYRFWEGFNMTEGSRWLTEFLQNPASASFPKARATALVIRAILEFHFQRFEHQSAAAEEAVKLARFVGDPISECDALSLLGSAKQMLEGMESKADFQGQALVIAREFGDVWRQAESLSGLSWDKRDPQKALAYREESIRLYRQIGDWLGLAWALSVLASDMAIAGNIEYAEKLLDEFSTLDQNLIDKRTLEFVLTARARIALLKGNYKQARAYLQTNIANLQELGNRMGYIWARARLGYVALCESNTQTAREIFEECTREFQRDGNRSGLIFTFELLSILFARLRQHERAAHLIGWVEAVRLVMGDVISQVIPEEWDRTIEAIRTNLGDEHFKSMRAKGGKMTVDEMVAH
ncbi:MAG: helix-turn-helix domain-containing protein, partial [Anaerolineales bacterium]|nr:helix-turn-helix domain-containing protein [Anaerolineales bacterium]